MIIGKLIAAGTGLPARGEQLEWTAKPRPLAAIFGAEEEELSALRPDEEVNLADLEDEEQGGCRPERGMRPKRAVTLTPRNNRVVKSGDNPADQAAVRRDESATLP